MSKKTSLTHEYVQENHKDDIVDPKSKGLTEKFILERSGTYWSTAKSKKLEEGQNRGDFFIPEVTIYGIHPDGYGLPCCMNKSVRNIKKGKPKQAKKPKEEKPKSETETVKSNSTSMTPNKKVDLKKKIYIPTTVGSYNFIFANTITKIIWTR